MGLLVHSDSSLSATDSQPTTLSLATPVPASSIHGKWATEVFRFALGQLGYGLIIRQCEPMVCTELANHGKVDGELLRYGGYQSRVPTLVRVSESPFPTTWSAFSTDSKLKLQSWQRLRDSQLKIGYLTGLPYLERNLLTEQTKSRLFKVRHWQIGLNDLNTRKIDVYIGADQVVTPFTQLPEYDNIYRAGIISSIPLYLYLNREFLQIATDLSPVIAEMKQTGQIAGFFQAIVSQHVLNPWSLTNTTID